MENETLEAKLRNQLSPIYGLADMILLIDEKPEMKQLIIEQAKQAVKNKEAIDLLLVEIEAKTLSKPDVSSAKRKFCPFCNNEVSRMQINCQSCDAHLMPD